MSIRHAVCVSLQLRQHCVSLDYIPKANRGMKRVVLPRNAVVRLRRSVRHDHFMRFRRAESVHTAPCSVLISFVPRRVRPIPTWNSFHVSCFSTSSSPPPPPHPKRDNKQESKQELTIHGWKQLKSPPNIITMARIASTPLLSYLIITENYELALYGCFAAGISDVLDGHLAKNYNMATVLGSYLDPLADKFLINVVSLSLWYADILPTPLICLWLARDVGLIGAAWYLYARSITTIKVEPTNISKVNTALQFLTLYVGLLQPLNYIPPGVLEAVCCISGATTIASGYSYIGGASLIASEIRGEVKQGIRTMAKKAKVRGDKIRCAVGRKQRPPENANDDI